MEIIGERGTFGERKLVLDRWVALQLFLMFGIVCVVGVDTWANIMNGDDLHDYWCFVGRVYWYNWYWDNYIGGYKVTKW